MSRSSVLFLSILLILSGCVESPGQTQGRENPKRSDDETSCPVYLITIKIRLKQHDGISDLTKENFVLYDNGVREDIRYWTKVSGAGDKEVVYALGYSPPVDALAGKLRRIRVEVRTKANKRLKAQFFPAVYSLPTG